MPSPNPYLSLCLICGDAHVELLPRVLKSLVDRPDGPMCDEIVIGWNGENHDAFTAAIRESGVSDAPVKTVIHRQKWVGDFAQARNENFSKASGVWRGYVDVDDVAPLADDPQVLDSIAEGFLVGEAPPTKSARLADWLRSLPPYRNCIYAPYNYVTSDKDRPLVRTRRPRVVRWDPWWTWTDSVHEKLVHILDRVYAVYNPGFLLIHKPVIEQDARQQRNFAILANRVQEMKAGGLDLPQHLVYGLAEHAFAQHMFVDAAKGYLSAAEVATDNESRAYYYSLAALSFFEVDKTTDAGAVALKIVETAPDSPDGYLLAAEAAFRLQKYAYAIKWYEAGGKRPFKIGGMLDNRVNRCLRPVRSVGVSYLRAGRFKEAIEVAEMALKEATDSFASGLKRVAQEAIDEGALLESIKGAVRALSERGAIQTASRVVEAIKYSYSYGLEDVEAELQSKLDRRVIRQWPANSIAMDWLTRAGTLTDAKIMTPLDALESPSDALHDARHIAGENNSVFFCSNDPQACDDFAYTSRVDVLPAKRVVQAAEEIGDVRTLHLLEGDGGGRALAVEVTGGGPTVGWQPDYTFWCPVFAESWGPWRLWRDGMGGSEEAVAYVAHELAKRGRRVAVYAPLDACTHRGIHIEAGVRWYPLDAFNPVQSIPGIAIAHRAPMAASLPAFDPQRTWIWHQDAAYVANWTPAVLRAFGHLFVSNWQSDVLLDGLGVTDAAGIRGSVIGNGVPESCFEWTEEGARDPYACAYISSPVRGLRHLLDAWPRILAAHPKATLNIFYGWHTTTGRMSGPAEASAALALRRRLMEQIVALGSSVVWRDRVPQAELEVILPKMGVLLYPTDFAEGFMNAGIRATAAGLVPCYRQFAALPEVQYPSEFAFPPEPSISSSDGQNQFVSAATRAIEASSKMSTEDRYRYRNWARKWLWSGVVDRMVEEVEGKATIAVGASK